MDTNRRAGLLRYPKGRRGSAAGATSRRRSPSLLLVLLVVGAATLLLVHAETPVSAAPLSQASTPQPNPQVSALLGAGDSAGQHSDYAGALSQYQQALTLAQQLGDLLGEGRAENSIGIVYLNERQFPQALDSFQQSLAVRQQIGDLAGQGQALSNIGLVYYDQGQDSQALDAYQQALPLRQASGDRAGTSLTLNNIGDLYYSQGQYAQALDNYQQALAIRQQLGDQAGQGGTLNSIGIVYRQEGQYGKALDNDQQALSIWQQLDNRTGEANTIDEIGYVYYLQGQYGQALTNFQQVLPIQQEIGDRAGAAATFNDLGLDYYAQGQYSQALTYFQQALSSRRDLGDRAGEGQTLSNIGLVYFVQGQYAQALDSFQQALPIRQGAGDRAGSAITLQNIGVAYGGQGQYGQALDAFQQALATFQQLGERDREGQTLSNIGYVYEQQGNLQQALDSYQQAITIREDVRSAAGTQEGEAGLAGLAANVYQGAVRVLLALSRPQDAFAMTERARARGFLDQLGNAPLDLSHGDPQLLGQEQDLRSQILAADQQLRTERAKPQDQQDQTLIASLQSQLDGAESQHGDVLQRLEASDPETASLVSVQPLQLGDIQKLLGANTTLLSYFITPDKTLAFLLTRSGFQEVDLPVKQADLEAAVADVRSFQDTNDPTPPQSLQQLYSWLIAPLAGQLQTAVVGIIPDGLLTDLPFAALFDGQQYFGDAHTLFELPDASALPYIQAKRKGTDTSAPVLAQSQPQGLPPLQYVDQEAQQVAALLGTTPLLDQAATVTAVQQQAGSVNVLHLAAHAELNAAAPLFSQILLAPDPSSPSASGGDGALTVQQVYGLNLAQADLVVLSACDTQLGGQNQGDDFVALNRAFIYAGSPSVIASLWVVNDQATSVLMTALYQHLTAGMSKAAALQAAQADTRAQFPNPYFWAGFVLTGDPGS